MKLIGKDGLNRDETSRFYWWEEIDGIRVLVEEHWGNYRVLNAVDFLAKMKLEINQRFKALAKDTAENIENASAFSDCWDRLIAKYDIYEEIAAAIGKDLKKKMYQSEHGEAYITKARAELANWRAKSIGLGEVWIAQ